MGEQTHDLSAPAPLAVDGQMAAVTDSPVPPQASPVSVYNVASHPELACQISMKCIKGIELRRTATDDPPGKSPVLAASDALADP